MSRRTTTRRSGGQALTELALTLPLIALLLVGLVELGFLLYAHVQVSSAAREAARAASLYRAIRFTAFEESELRSGNNVRIPTCSGIDGWPLQAVIENAVVRRQPLASGNNRGCPNPAGTIVYSALGRLDPTQAPSSTPLPAPCPTGNASGWVVGIHDSTPSFTQSGTNQTPAAGTRATVTLCYPYRLIIASSLLNFNDPIWIGKSVVFQYQQ